ncbi:hypothetical protein L1049_016599 [Liquidambar formosana]|uniref:LysM domain-containing protein n=1 Tax=Liquidambar formosana TaxID=63359 RepID=A0AAP0S5J0_LIQFO
MDKPDKPHNFEPQIYNMERGARDKLIADYNTMDIWDFNEKYGDLWDFTVKRDDITKRLKSKVGSFRIAHRFSLYKFHGGDRDFGGASGGFGHEDRSGLKAQPAPNTTGYACPINETNTYPCQTYAFYRASAPNFLDLASIGDLFSLSRLMISNPSNISSPASPLVPDQPLFVPLSCSCNSVNDTYGSISYANLTYTIKSGDTFYIVSTIYFRNLTTYQSVEIVNPTLVPTQLEIGVNVIFPIFCKCPNTTQRQNQVNFLISYVIQPSDTLSSIASFLGINYTVYY